MKTIIFFVVLFLVANWFHTCELQSWEHQGLGNPSRFEKDGEYDDR
jgi:hypothetical protein